MDNGCSLVVEERLVAQGCLVFGLGTLPNIRFRQCFQDQILHTNCAENQGSWNGSSPIKRNSSEITLPEITLPSYASNSISLVSRKDFFNKGFLKLSKQVSSRTKLFA